jgi:uncharacterized protein RhaS with RHS repeats
LNLGVTGLYNYGYRDYQPEAARFTTVDPVRDGANWFAYVNNNPVNYVDPLGLRPVTTEEQQLHQQAGGSPVDYGQIDINDDRKPTVDEVEQALEDLGIGHGFTSDEIQGYIDGHPAMSLPGGSIYAPNDPDRTENGNKALTAHEIEHQAQYQNGNAKEVFEQLVQEAQRGPSVYNDPNALEGKAQQVEDNALSILDSSQNIADIAGKGN